MTIFRIPSNAIIFVLRILLLLMWCDAAKSGSTCSLKEQDILCSGKQRKNLLQKRVHNDLRIYTSYTLSASSYCIWGGISSTGLAVHCHIRCWLFRLHFQSYVGAWESTSTLQTSFLWQSKSTCCLPFPMLTEVCDYYSIWLWFQVIVVYPVVWGAPTMVG